MRIEHTTLSYQTENEFHFIDITEEAQQLLQRSHVQDGMLNVQTMHTTAGILVNENEPLLIEDIKLHLEALSSKEKTYHHDDFDRRQNISADEPVNGHSHCKATHLCANATINIEGGKLMLGRWQKILFVELDRSRSRQIHMTVMGE